MYLERAVSVYGHRCTGTVGGLGRGEFGKVWDPQGPPAAGRTDFCEELGKTLAGRIFGMMQEVRAGVGAPCT